MLISCGQSRVSAAQLDCETCEAVTDCHTQGGVLTMEQRKCVMVSELVCEFLNFSRSMIESYNSSLEILANSFSAVVGLNLEWQFQLVMNMIISAGLRALALLCCL